MKTWTLLLLAPLLIAADGQPAAPSPTTAPAQGPPLERRLHLGTVEASSFLWNDWNKFQENYHPLYLGDDDPGTAWVEGAKGPGVGEWVRLKITALSGATRVRLRIRNGYQKSAHLYQANERVKDLEVKLLPSGKVLPATLTDAQGWQELVVEQPAGPLEAIEVTVKSIYPGKNYEDLCISDIQVFATATTHDNPAFEKARFDKLIAWKKDRVKAAEIFKADSAKTMPVAPQYRREVAYPWQEMRNPCKPNDDFCRTSTALTVAQKRIKDPAEFAASFAVARAALSGMLAGFTPVQAVPKDTRKLPAIDGLCTPQLSCDSVGCDDAVELPLGGALGLLQTAQLATFDVKAPPPVEQLFSARAPACHGDDKTFAWASRDTAAGKPILRALFLVECGEVYAREGSGYTAQAQLLVYDDRGRLALIASPNYVSLLRWRDRPEGPIIAGVSSVSMQHDGSEVTEAGTLAKR